MPVSAEQIIYYLGGPARPGISGDARNSVYQISKSGAVHTYINIEQVTLTHAGFRRALIRYI